MAAPQQAALRKIPIPTAAKKNSPFSSTYNNGLFAA
jgi:hypothetical protein